ncbi:RNA 2',3'-cyclic phosphodiesterase [Alkalicoccus luteus]|uniref:RNA 2',3'-cyclic phosphodiesterase n=1 Tax=Alkalicoccus luteus TaxID=1237094 RepID=A0A969TU40_9BACI|nr:RNA 2',3'-cyclic phosphodiesterase [Alkalicoccus luteus]NJP36940.1 RNA 2',3'-cyclic phosphodiesterase [Alkalicoccus luteus]
MSAHYFLGFHADITVREKAVQMQHKLQAADYFRHLTGPQDFHVTLLFLGGWVQGRREKLWTQLQDKQLPAFSLTFSRYAVFGRSERPRVLFLRPDPEGALDEIYQTVIREAARLDFPVPARGYHPHLTLAKKAGKRPFPEPVYGDMEPVTMPVQKLTLYKVRPESNPRYQAEKTIDLGERR